MKRIVICCDGTWNRADACEGETPTPTNVVRMSYLAAKRDGDGSPQVLFYDQGVGTGNSLDRLSGGAFGLGLDANIFDAYRFLIGNYERGDELFLLGFSRGAFTVRSLVGLIRSSGILKRECVDRYHEAIDIYRRPDCHPNDSSSITFREQSSIGEHEGEGPRIRFIGVWDTVGALGVPLRGLRWLTRRKRQFHDLRLSSRVDHACHALAIDERRAPFAPTLFWKNPEDKEQHVEQVWFAGAHSDVGGGYRERGLSDLALGWMIERAQDAGLALDASVLDHFHPSGDPKGILHYSKTMLYRLTPGIDRPVGLRPKDPAGHGTSELEPDPTQTVHSSVLERWNANPRYRPPGLRDYFRRTGDERADED